MRLKSLILFCSFTVFLNNAATCSDSSENSKGPWDFCLKIVVTPAAEASMLKRSLPEEPVAADSADSAESAESVEDEPPKRARRQAPEVPSATQPLQLNAVRAEFNSQLDQPSAHLQSPQQLAAELSIMYEAIVHPKPEFQQISRENRNRICFLPGDGDVNKLYLTYLSPQDVKSVMLTCRRGYWLGRTRGYIHLADPRTVRYQSKSFYNFMAAMVSDPEFPVKELDLSCLDTPRFLFDHLRGLGKLTLLTDKLISYTWTNTTFRNTRIEDPFPAQIDMIASCSNLRRLVISALDAVDPYDQSLVSEEERTRVYNNIVRLTSAVKGLEIFKCGQRWNFPLRHYHAILRGFKHLKVLDYVPAALFLNGENPFKILEDENNPQSGCLSFPSLQEIVIDRANDILPNDQFLGSLFQACSNLRKLGFGCFVTSATISAVRNAFFKFPTLQEVSIGLKKEEVRQTFVLSRKKPDGTLQLRANRFFSYPSSAFTFFDTLNEEFPRELYPDLMVREMTLDHFGEARYSNPCTREELIEISRRLAIYGVQFLHLPGLGEYPVKTFIQFLNNLPYLEELDLSNSSKTLRETAFLFAAGKAKHLDISRRAKMQPGIISKMLVLKKLKFLTLSYIQQQDRGLIHDVINQAMVEEWRAQYPETTIIVRPETLMRKAKQARKRYKKAADQ